jgi:hypothetical protein
LVVILPSVLWSGWSVKVGGARRSGETKRR